MKDIHTQYSDFKNGSVCFSVREWSLSENEKYDASVVILPNRSSNPNPVIVFREQGNDLATITAKAEEIFKAISDLGGKVK